MLIKPTVPTYAVGVRTGWPDRWEYPLVLAASVIAWRQPGKDDRQTDRIGRPLWVPIVDVDGQPRELGLYPWRIITDLGQLRSAACELLHDEARALEDKKRLDPEAWSHYHRSEWERLRSCARASMLLLDPAAVRLFQPGEPPSWWRIALSGWDDRGRQSDLEVFERLFRRALSPVIVDCQKAVAGAADPTD